MSSHFYPAGTTTSWALGLIGQLLDTIASGDKPSSRVHGVCLSAVRVVFDFQRRIGLLYVAIFVVQGRRFHALGYCASESTHVALLVLKS